MTEIILEINKVLKLLQKQVDEINSILQDQELDIEILKEKIQELEDFIHEVH